MLFYTPSTYLLNNDIEDSINSSSSCCGQLRDHSAQARYTRIVPTTLFNFSGGVRETIYLCSGIGYTANTFYEMQPLGVSLKRTVQ